MPAAAAAAIVAMLVNCDVLFSLAWHPKKEKINIFEHNY
jgi:hypothetical protein